MSDLRRKVVEYFSRKFVLAGGALVGSFVLAFSSLEMGGWIGAITAILAFYNGSNVYAEYLASKRPEPGSKSASNISEENKGE